MHRVLVLVLLVLSVASLAATPANRAVLGEDQCAVGPGLQDAALDGHDLCTVTVDVDGVGTAGVGLTVEMDAVGDVPRGSDHLVSLTLGDCILQLRASDDVTTDTTLVNASSTDAYLGCGAFERTCTFTTTDPAMPLQDFNCSRRYADVVRVDIPTPQVDGGRLTFTVAMTGNLARVRDLLAPERTVALEFAVAAPDLPFFIGGALLAPEVCIAGDCGEVAGDVVEGTGELRLQDETV